MKKWAFAGKRAVAVFRFCYASEASLFGDRLLGYYNQGKIILTLSGCNISEPEEKDTGTVPENYIQAGNHALSSGSIEINRENVELFIK